MDIIQLGTQLLSEKLGLQVDPETISSALAGLLSDGSGNLDLAGLASRMASSGELGNILNSWLGDGASSAISPENILGVLGSGKVSEFASSVGTDTQTAAAGLAEVIPQLMDKASSGGKLLESSGGLGSLLGAASSFLK